jgi:hypothetical protein
MPQQYAAQAHGYACSRGPHRLQHATLWWPLHLSLHVSLCTPTTPELQPVRLPRPQRPALLRGGMLTASLSSRRCLGMLSLAGSVKLESQQAVHTIFSHPDVCHARSVSNGRERHKVGHLALI